MNEEIDGIDLTNIYINKGVALVKLERYEEAIPVLCRCLGFHRSVEIY